jgi:nucleoside-diphosphate-sugar epimerase
MTMPMGSPSFWSQRRVLVTGGTGFFGSHVCRRIVEAGGDVYATSRTKTGVEDGITWFKADFSDLEAARATIANVKPSVVYHFAGSVGAAPDLKLVVSTYHSLLTSTVNALTAAAEAGCERIILPGSLTEALPDEDPPVPRSPYAAAKWAASGYGRMFHELFGTPTVILRTFMTYGPAQHASKLIPSVTRALLQGERPKLSSGRGKADWVYIDDVAEAFLLAASTPGIEGKTIDIGSGTLVPMRSLIETLVKVVGAGIEPAFGALPDRPGENQIIAQTGPAATLMGWRATTPLESGLRQTADWHRAQLVTC